MTRRRKRQSDDPPPLFFEDLIITDAERIACNNNTQCIFDLIATGDMTVAMATLEFETETLALREELGMLTMYTDSICYELALHCTIQQGWGKKIFCVVGF